MGRTRISRSAMALAGAAWTLTVGTGAGPESDAASIAATDLCATPEAVAAIRVRQQAGPKERYGFAERRQRPRLA